MGKFGHYGKTVCYRTESERRFFVEDINSQNIMQRKFFTDRYYFEYDTKNFDFAQQIKRLLVKKGLISAATAEAGSLQTLHTVLTDQQKSLDESELNSISKAFYDTDGDFLCLYRRFIKFVIAALFGEDLFFQAVPTVRFQFPHQSGFNWRPRFHTDIMLGHPPRGVNIWIPLTSVFDSNSMLIANMKDSMELLQSLDYDFDELALRVQTNECFWQSCADKASPARLNYGEYLLFDPRCLHATQYNVTSVTRVSIDIRVIPRCDMEALKLDYRGTGRLRMKFAPGHYYTAESTSELVESHLSQT